MTLSCADNFWPDLLKLLDQVYTNNNKQVPNSTQQKINDNPHIVTEFFYNRVLNFFKTVLIPMFKISDYYIRFEF